MRTALHALDGLMTAGHAHQLQAAKIQAVMLYARPDRCTKSLVEGLRSLGIKVGFVFEKGNPTSDLYGWTEAKGHEDGKRCADFMAAMGAPADTATPHFPGFSGIDYDPLASRIDGPIHEYQGGFQGELKGVGFLAGDYGSGLTCEHLEEQGVSHFGWLDQSKGHAGHTEFLKRAAIVQGPSGTLAGIAIDWDTVLTPAVVF